MVGQEVASTGGVLNGADECRLLYAHAMEFTETAGSRVQREVPAVEARV